MYNSVNLYALCIGTFDYDFGNLRKLVLSEVWFSLTQLEIFQLALYCFSAYLSFPIISLVIWASFLNFECSLREATYCWNPFEIFSSKQQNLYIFVYLWYSRMYLLFWRVKNHWWFNNYYIFFRVCVIKIYLVPG